MHEIFTQKGFHFVDLHFVRFVFMYLRTNVIGSLQNEIGKLNIDAYVSIAHVFCFNWTNITSKIV